MRVEVEPLRQVGASTEVAVIVQVSPEDRLRIGANAILRIELDGGAVSSGSPMRAVRLEDDGSTRVVIAWPPGTHQLRVEIEDPSKEDTGLWVGTVRIPDLGPDAGVRKIDEPQSVPVPVPFPNPKARRRQLRPQVIQRTRPRQSRRQPPHRLWQRPRSQNPPPSLSQQSKNRRTPEPSPNLYRSRPPATHRRSWSRRPSAPPLCLRHPNR